MLAEVCVYYYDKTFDADHQYFCESDSVRTSLINNNNWIFIGNTYGCTEDNYLMNLTGIETWNHHSINWSKGHIPKECENVIVDGAFNLIIEEGNSIIINSINTLKVQPSKFTLAVI